MQLSSRISTLYHSRSICPPVERFFHLNPHQPHLSGLHFSSLDVIRPRLMARKCGSTGWALRPRMSRAKAPPSQPQYLARSPVVAVAAGVAVVGADPCNAIFFAGLRINQLNIFVCCLTTRRSKNTQQLQANPLRTLHGKEGKKAKIQNNYRNLRLPLVGSLPNAIALNPKRNR